MIIAIFELFLVIASFLYGQYVGENKDKVEYQQEELTAIASQKAADGVAYKSLDEDQDGDIKYGTDEHKKYIAAQKSLNDYIKKHPINANCKPNASIVQSLNRLSSSKK